MTDLEIYLARLALEKWTRKMELCHLYGSNCGMCMVAAPYSYCCRAECGEKEYCEGCEYTSGNKWED